MSSLQKSVAILKGLLDDPLQIYSSALFFEDGGVQLPGRLVRRARMDPRDPKLMATRFGNCILVTSSAECGTALPLAKQGFAKNAAPLAVPLSPEDTKFVRGSLGKDAVVLIGVGALMIAARSELGGAPRKVLPFQQAIAKINQAGVTSAKAALRLKPEDVLAWNQAATFQPSAGCLGVFMRGWLLEIAGLPAGTPLRITKYQNCVVFEPTQAALACASVGGNRPKLDGVRSPSIFVGEPLMAQSLAEPVTFIATSFGLIATKDSNLAKACAPGKCVARGGARVLHSLVAEGIAVAEGEMELDARGVLVQSYRVGASRRSLPVKA